MKKVYTVVISLFFLALASASCQKENMKAPDEKKSQSPQQDKTGSGTVVAENPNAAPNDPPPHPQCPGH